MTELDYRLAMTVCWAAVVVAVIGALLWPGWDGWAIVAVLVGCGCWETRAWLLARREERRR